MMATSNNTTDATLTEHLPASDNHDDSIDGAAEITYARDGNGVWRTDSGESIDEVTRYGVKCACGETFDTWQKATEHAEEEH
jgi:hypothetical protein